MCFHILFDDKVEFAPSQQGRRGFIMCKKGFDKHLAPIQSLFSLATKHPTKFSVHLPHLERYLIFFFDGVGHVVLSLYISMADVLHHMLAISIGHD